MNDFIAASFAKQIDDLEKAIRGQWAWPSPETGFALHLYATAGERGPVPDSRQCNWPNSALIRHPQHLAAAGFLLATDPSLATGDRLSEWAAALEHLTKKDPFPLDRQSFAHRPVELLGIANGAAKCSAVTAQTQTQLQGILRRLPASGNRDLWSMGIYAIAAHLLGVPWTHEFSPPFDLLPIEILALLKWMSLGYPTTPTARHAIANVSQLDLALLKAAAVGLTDSPDVACSAVLHCGLRRAVLERIQSTVEDAWQINRASRDSLAMIEQLCRRFPLFARQIQDRRNDVSVPGSKTKRKRPTIEMKDEYDVQDALFAILRMHFDDVRSEEWTPSYGGSHTRMDFLLKRERIVIETKMMRPSLTQANLVDELIIDKEHYRHHPDCQTLVCFVYDPEGRCPNPAAVEGDLSVTDGDFRVVVIISPRGV
jgi:hypothetical protein